MNVEGVMQCENVVPATITVDGTYLGKVWIRIRDQKAGCNVQSLDSVLVSPKNAVMMWRCLTGEIEKCHFNEDGYKVSLEYTGDSELWWLKLQKFSMYLNADEALALAWSLKKSTVECLETAPSFTMKDNVKDTPNLFQHTTMTWPAKVWVLAARRMLIGDCAENGVDQLGGCEQVYLTEEAARDAVREFMRPLVNDSFGESYWEERTVDDELDDIMAVTDANKTNVWILDGQKQAFEVELTEREVLT